MYSEAAISGDEESKGESKTPKTQKPLRVKRTKSELSHEFQIVASDTTVFQDYTRGYYNVADREIWKISLDSQLELTQVKKVAEKV